jgi:hypothetical protein
MRKNMSQDSGQQNKEKQLKENGKILSGIDII